MRNRYLNDMYYRQKLKHQNITIGVDKMEDRKIAINVKEYIDLLEYRVNYKNLIASLERMINDGALSYDKRYLIVDERTLAFLLGTISNEYDRKMSVLKCIEEGNIEGENEDVK